MHRYKFSLRTDEQVREAGVVKSDSFHGAFSALDKHLGARAGDTLEIGVTGFPPVRYECVFSADDGGLQWRPARKLAA